MKLGIEASGLLKTEWSGAGHTRTAPIDMSHLSRQSLGDEALGSEILQLFVESVHIYLERITSTVAPTEKVVHLRRLRLAATGVGAFRLADMVRLAELELSVEPTETECLSDLGFAVEEVTTFITREGLSLAA